MSGAQDASDGPSAQDWLEVTESLTASRQTMLGLLLTSGNIAAEGEIEMREDLSRELPALFEATQRPSYLYDAIDQVETILRRLADSTPDLPLYLDELSSLRVSEYGITNSAIPLSVLHPLSLSPSTHPCSP
jgi:hypothetical protein